MNNRYQKKKKKRVTITRNKFYFFLTWYAMSKKGSSSLSLMTLLISSHCSALGSTPVGLWAQAWSMIKLPLGIFWNKKAYSEESITSITKSNTDCSHFETLSTLYLCTKGNKHDIHSNDTHRNVLYCAIEVESTGLWVVVSVLIDIHIDMFEDGNMVAPSWCWQPYILGDKKKNCTLKDFAYKEEGKERER